MCSPRIVIKPHYKVQTYLFLTLEIPYSHFIPTENYSPANNFRLIFRIYYTFCIHTIFLFIYERKLYDQNFELTIKSTFVLF